MKKILVWNIKNANNKPKNNISKKFYLYHAIPAILLTYGISYYTGIYSIWFCLLLEFVLASYVLTYFLNKKKYVVISTLLLNFLFLYLVYTNNFYVFLFIIGLIFSILLHEVGHLLFTLLSGVKVVEFSIGFGENILGFKWKGIQWNIRNILLGGFVRFVDDNIREFQNIKKYKKLYNTNNTEDLIKIIARKYQIALDKLYITKKYRQKFFILTGGVLMNLVLAITFLIPLKLNLFHNQNITDKPLTEKQLIGLKKIYQQSNEKDLNNLREYVSNHVKNTIWLGTSKTHSLKDINIPEETYKGILITYYSFKYAFDNPKVLLYFQSIVGLGKNIKLQEDYDLINMYILLFILALVNISLFFVNLLPFPALDGGVLFKETLASIINNISVLLKKKTIYYDIVFHRYIMYSELFSFYVLTGFGVFIIIKDLII